MAKQLNCYVKVNTTLLNIHLIKNFYYHKLPLTEVKFETKTRFGIYEKKIVLYIN